MPELQGFPGFSLTKRADDGTGLRRLFQWCDLRWRHSRIVKAKNSFGGGFGKVRVAVFSNFVGWIWLDKLGWNGMEWVTLFSRNDGSNGFLNLHDK